MINTGTAITAVTAGASGFMIYLFGNWDFWLQFLLVVMGIDIITGVMKAYYQKSEKTESGGFRSSTFTKGLLTKGACLLIIVIAVQVDVIFAQTGNPIDLLFFGTVRNAVIMFFWLGEVMSILENCGEMGMPLPKPLIKFLDVLSDKIDDVSDDPKD